MRLGGLLRLTLLVFWTASTGLDAAPRRVQPPRPKMKQPKPASAPTRKASPIPAPSAPALPEQALAAAGLDPVQRARKGMALYRDEMLSPSPRVASRPGQRVHDEVLAAITQALADSRADAGTLAAERERLGPGEVRDSLAVFLALTGKGEVRADVEAILAKPGPTAVRALAATGLGRIAIATGDPATGAALAGAIRTDAAIVYAWPAPAAGAARPVAATAPERRFPVREAAARAIRRMLAQTAGNGHSLVGHDVPAPWETGIEVELTLGAELVAPGQVVELAVLAEDYDHCSLPDCPWPQGKTLDPLTLQWAAENAELGTVDGAGQFQPAPHPTSPVTHFRCTQPGEAWIQVIADDEPMLFVPILGGAERHDDHAGFAVGLVSVDGHVHWPVTTGAPIAEPDLILPQEVVPGELVNVQFTPEDDLDLCAAEGCTLPGAQIVDAVRKFGWQANVGQFGFLDGAGQWNVSSNPDLITHWKAPAEPGPVTLYLLLDDVAAFWDPGLQDWWPAANDPSLWTTYQLTVIEVPGGPHEHEWTPEQFYRIKAPSFSAGTGETDQVIPLTVFVPSPGDEDFCTAANCPIPGRIVPNAVTRAWSDGGGGGQFGYLQGPNFVATSDPELVTHYRCPPATGSVTLTLTLDDLWEGVPEPGSEMPIDTDNDPPRVVQKSLTVTVPMHHHQWADDVNEARWPIFLQRDGQDVDSVTAGEVLAIRKGTLQPDTDVCLAGGCPFGGPANEPAGLHEVTTYRDDRGGRFGRLTTAGDFEALPASMFSAITHYQPSPFLAEGDSVCIWIDIDDAGVAPYPMETNIFNTCRNDDATTAEQAKDAATCYPVHYATGMVDMREIEADDACGCATCAPGNSSIDPRTGAVRFEVPVTSWPFRGAELGLTLHYDSNSRTDPRLRTADRTDMNAHPDFAHFSYRNSKWSHNWAQFVEVIGDPVGEWTALWHTGDGGVKPFHLVGPPFRHVASFQPTWVADDSYHSMTSFGQTRVWMLVDGRKVERVLPYSQFTVVDGEGTRYRFQHTYIETGVMAAVPYFLLTQVEDRLGRRVNLTWSGRLLQRVKDDTNQELVFTYAGNNRVTSVSDPWGRSHTFGYTEMPEVPGNFPAHRLTSATIRGPGSPAASWSWGFDYGSATDAETYYGGTFSGDLVIRKSEPGGRLVHYAYAGVAAAREEPGDWDGRLVHTWYEDRLATNSQPVVFDTQRVGTTLIYPGGRSVTYGYNGHELATLTNETGQTVSYTYDALQNLTSIRTNAEPEGMPPLVSIAYEFAADNRTIVKSTLTNVLGEVTEVNFNPLNLPYLLVQRKRTLDGQPYDRTTQWGYGSGGVPGWISSGSPGYGQDSTSLTYGNPDLPGVPTAISDFVGRTWQVLYDPQGRPTEFKSPPNPTAGQGHPDAAPSVTRLHYQDGLVDTLTDPDGRVWRQSVGLYGGQLHVNTTRPGQGQSSRAIYDAAGRLLSATDELGLTTRAAYSKDGRLLESTEGHGTTQARTTRYQYNLRGEMVVLIPPKGPNSAVQFDYRAYDQNGLLVSPIRQEGQVTRIVHPGGDIEYFGYDDLGRPAWSGRKVGENVALTAVVQSRDALHRVTSVEVPAFDGVPGYTATFVYDEFGRVRRSTDATGETQYWYDALDRPLEIRPPSPRQRVYFGYGANPSGHTDSTFARLNSLSGPTWEFVRDAKGRDGGTLDPSGNIAAYEYYPSGRVWRRHVTGVTSKITTYGYTGDTLSSIHHQGQVQAIDAFVLQRDAVGRVTRETDAGGRAHDYEYDVLGQLIRETHPDLGSGIDYTYDPHGNRTSVTRNGVTEWYGVNAADQLLWTNTAGNVAPSPNQSAPFNLFGYDSAGNLVSRTRKTTTADPARSMAFSWTADGRLAQVMEGTVSRFTASYAGDGERVQKTDTTGTHRYHWGLLEEGTTEDEWRRHTPGVGYTKSIIVGDFHYQHEDHLGNTRYVSTNALPGFPDPHEDIRTALRYDAYGNVTQAAGIELDDGTGNPVTAPARHQYAGAWGYEREPQANGLGLDYLYQRYYDPQIGRFISRDPIGWAGGPNLYGYVENDPVNYADPYGLERTYAGDVLEVFKGYGDVLNPINSIRGLVQLGQIASTCGVKAAGAAFVNGIGQTIAGLGSDDPREFGRSFGTALAAASPLMKRIPSPTMRLYRAVGSQEAAIVSEAGALVSNARPFRGATRVFQGHANIPRMLECLPDRTHLVEVRVRLLWRLDERFGGAFIAHDHLKWAHYVNVDRLARYQVGKARVIELPAP